MRYWFVNQGTSYEYERKGNFLYAPKNNIHGQSFQHWLDVKKIKQGDIIFCNNKGNILSIAKAVTDGYNSVIPESIEELWQKYGYKVDVEYYDLKNKLRFSDYKDEYMDGIDLSKNPFTVKGTAKMGYLFPIEDHIAQLFIDSIKDNNIYTFINSDAETVFEEMAELQEEEEQFENISSGIIKPYSEEELKIKDKEKFVYEPKVSKEKEKVVRKTDGKLKASRMEKADYNCEINNNHFTFTSSSGKNQYLESHHIIPIKAQKDFPNTNLDSLFNLIALCPTCHMQVHHAIEEEKRDIFYKMYNLRKDEMIEHGFDENKIEEIFKKYYL